MMGLDWEGVVVWPSRWMEGGDGCYPIERRNEMVDTHGVHEIR